ncbi:MAG: DNA-processing protein DprA [Alistipes sp.]|nr:DNA-processing protein DprA [Candidatus Minthomonas equi]
MEYSDLVYACALNRIFNYDCRLGKRVMERYPHPGTLFSWKADELCGLFGRNSKYPGLFTDRKFLDEAADEVEWASSKGVRILCFNEADYPYRLRECEDAPLILFKAGNAELNASRVISVVGTRKVTSYGLGVCRSIIQELASLEEPPLVVSGLAYGVDICAHREALSLGLSTVGVMATGINDIYPHAHRADAAAMCRQGGIVTDFWRNAPPDRINFLRRNRIIAGLCDAVVLVESDKSGGGIVTSKMAFSYSREVFAVPGRINDRYSAGCNLLISEKIAESLSSPDRIGTLMGWKKRCGALSSEGAAELFSGDSDVKKNIIVLLSNGSGMDADSLCERLHFDCQEIMTALTALEMEGRIILDGRGVYGLKKYMVGSND